MEELVTVKSFTYAHEAAIAKSLLQSRGIFCFLKDELTIQANPFYSNALGGVKLQVREEDAAVAAELLQNQPSENHDPIVIQTDSGTISECPACGSEEISLVKRPSLTVFGLSLMFLGFPITSFTQVYHCYGCGRDIRVTKRKQT